MRRRLSLAIIVALVMGIVAGCGGATSPGSSVAEKAWKAGDKTDLNLATGGTGGTYYPLGGAMSKVWKDSIPGVNVTVQATGASVANIRLLAKGEIELALVQNDVADYGRNGKEAFAEKNEKYTNYRAIAALYPEVVQIVVRADSAIKTVADLKGKKVVVGAAGSGTELASKQIFGVYGLTYKDMTALYVPFTEGATAFKEKNADAMVLVTGVPAAALADVQTATNIRLLPVEVSKLKKDYPFYVSYTSKSGTYKGGDADVATVAVLATLVVREDMNSDLVYQLTKNIFDKLADLGAGHAKAKEFDIKKAADGVSIPFHPGAIKYLKEKGITAK